MPSLAVPGRGRYNSGPRGSQQLRTKQESAMGEPSPGAPSERPPEDRLDSWKEIAAYLERDVTTVQRWEKREGMPVHRHLHDKLGSVYASRSELDAWTRSRTLAQTPTRDEKETAKSAPARLSWALAVGAAVVVLAAIGAYAWLRAH